MTIYTITTIGKSCSALKIPDRYRFVGWYHNLWEASWSARMNVHLYEDGYYPYLVIEELEPGVYPKSKSKYLYKWDKEEEEYCAILHKQNFPAWFRDGKNFGIG